MVARIAKLELFSNSADEGLQDSVGVHVDADAVKCDAKIEALRA